MTITEPGIYTIPAADYHADPAPAPSLSSHVARELLGQSPEHARWAHPRLNTAYEAEVSARFDIGTVAHAALLEQRSDFAIVEAEAWTTKAAKGLRDAARAEGKTPILERHWGEVQLMVVAARRQLEAHQDRPTPLTGEGKAEQTLVWLDDGVWCRARLDWLFDDCSCVDDYKTTDGSANPEVFARRTIWGLGYDVQAAFYLRGLQAIRRAARPRFRLVVQETYAPFALSVLSLTPEALELAGRKVAYAIDRWRECLRTGVFPGYPKQTVSAELPGWEEAQWIEREARDSWARGVEDDGRPIDEQMNRE